MSQTVFYFLHGTSVPSFYVDMVLILYIAFDQASDQLAKF